MDFNIIYDLIENEKYPEAKQQLKVIINNCNNSEKDISIANYLEGYIYTCWDNKEKSDWKAKRALLNSIDSSYPIPRAFNLYASIEEDKNIALNYLNKGLEKFPANPEIYTGLLKYSPKLEQLKVISEIKEKDLSEYVLIKKVIQLLISYEYWDDVDKLSEKVIQNNSISVNKKNYLKLLSAYSKLLTKVEINIIEALRIFESLIDQDVQNSLFYAHYMGAISCRIFLNDYTEVKKYFDKLPINNILQDLNNSPDCVVEINFVKIYIPIFDKLTKIFMNDKERKQKNNCLKALYLYSPYEMFEVVRFTKKHINYLKKYYQKNVDNLVVGCAIFNMECGLKLNFNAYLTYMEMLKNNLNPNDRDAYASILIEDCSGEDLERIYEDACKKIDMNSDLHMSIVVTQIMDPIVDWYWEKGDIEGKYNKIVGISQKIDIPYLGESDKLFEISYSYNECKNPKSKELYEILLKKQPNCTAALNNLGVLYEVGGNLLNAEECFNKAFEIDSTSEIYSRNLKRVKIILDNYRVAFEKVKNESIWFIGRLSLFYDIASESGEIECTYKNRPIVLKARPEKADELVDKMLKNSYIEKVANNNYHTPATYRINPLIKTFLKEKFLKIENNRVYEKISEKLNIDTIEEMGYTDELVDLLNNITESGIKEILKRDLRECVVCLITEQNKAAIIMCGSVIEALLMNKILERKLERYDIGLLSNKISKFKKVIDMDINELIFVADIENLIKKEHFHLSHFARGYRNIIHPACEIRKGFEVSNKEAKFMWEILLKIIKSTLSH